MSPSPPVRTNATTPTSATTPSAPPPSPAAALGTAEELARAFTRAPVDKVADLLETLATLGHARSAGEGRFVAWHPPRRSGTQRDRTRMRNAAPSAPQFV